MLKVSYINKLYGDKGVRDVSFSIGKGKILAVVGPNGAGKSTLLKSICGIIPYDSGSIFYDDTKLEDKNIQIGYMPEFPSLPGFFNPEQTIRYILSMREMHMSEEEIFAFLKSFQIESFANKKNEFLSQGMKKRLMMAIAFLGEPEILVLDEPTNGMDTQGILCLKRHLLTYKEKGKIIIVSSHILDFLDNISDEVLFLSKGSSYMQNTKDNKSIEEIYIKIFGEY